VSWTQRALRLVGSVAVTSEEAQACWEGRPYLWQNHRWGFWLFLKATSELARIDMAHDQFATTLDAGPKLHSRQLSAHHGCNGGSDDREGNIVDRSLGRSWLRPRTSEKWMTSPLIFRGPSPKPFHLSCSVPREGLWPQMQANSRKRP